MSADGGAILKLIVAILYIIAIIIVVTVLFYLRFGAAAFIILIFEGFIVTFLILTGVFSLRLRRVIQT